MIDPHIKLLILLVDVLVMVALAVWYTRRGGSWKYHACVVLAIVNTVVGITGCGDTINPVRFQPVEVLVTKPCFAGRNPPAEAVTLTQEQCTATGQCVRVCTDPRPEVCVTHAVADITELQREAGQYRNLFKECSK